MAIILGDLLTTKLRSSCFLFNKPSAFVYKTVQEPSPSGWLILKVFLKLFASFFFSNCQTFSPVPDLVSGFSPTHCQFVFSLFCHFYHQVLSPLFSLLNLLARNALNASHSFGVLSGFRKTSLYGLLRPQVFAKDKITFNLEVLNKT